MANSSVVMNHYRDHNIIDFRIITVGRKYPLVVDSPNARQGLPVGQRMKGRKHRRMDHAAKANKARLQSGQV
jgi:hypothetical protein